MTPSDRLLRFCQRLINQTAARPIIAPHAPESGFWFGGGNMVRDNDGRLFIVGRYRDAGDSRTGVTAGTRGCELAIFESQDQGQSFQKILSWDKASLNTPDADVISIEGSCLRLTSSGAELFVSTEKTRLSYPDQLAAFLKPGAGVWTIDVLRADSLRNLRNAAAKPWLQSDNPEHLHVKDPFFWPGAAQDRLGFCSHPFTWSSSNTSMASIPLTGGPAADTRFGVIARGTTWDVAMTRGTCVLPIPQTGPFQDRPVSLLFYCGGECLRPHQEHQTAVHRPRGYSCEELGGAAFFINDDLGSLTRLSALQPLFVSPWGTGCSRYVDVLETPEGYYATWQQSQADLSQPLVLNFLARDEAEQLLMGDA